MPPKPPSQLPPKRCPCGTGLSFDQCCGKYHAGQPAPTAEALMRSRFSAFVTGDSRYLLDTWDPQTRPSELNLEDMPVRFYRLEIVHAEGGGLFDSTGVVEFEAFYKGAASGSQRERSTFHRHNGRWYYSSGEVE
ncbi:YchJ family protein [Corynebacterium lizhenjunii]|uniref:YchJ family protein n=1 Tax=Corynebacterium lizhenjunii TaxID=2709394 RepID=UPI0013EA2ECF|nr:YchJ family metal-binding protein [Corynebacterium lizhenjunii]